ncbi:MAG: histidine kinase [Nitrosarchaeum sp.]|nr:histidine kinase [Nitrosarchaeum sp.]
MEPDKVPEKLTIKINKKILLLILAMVIGFQGFITIMPSSDELDVFISFVSIINPLVASVVSFLIAKRYGNSMVFGKAYLILGAGLFMMFLGESSWYYIQNVLGEEPFPSVADVFFFAFYPLSIVHIILNIRFFGVKFNAKTKLWLVSLPTVIIVLYTILTLQQNNELNFDFFYGLLFVVFSSSLMSLSLLGALSFRGGMLSIAWSLLMLGIMLTTIGDVWYFYLQTFNAYVEGHPVELFWYASYWVITYGLYKHKKAI